MNFACKSKVDDRLVRALYYIVEKRIGKLRLKKFTSEILDVY